MEDLDFTQPSQSPIYDPAAATAFFKSAGTVENVAAGKEFFAEHQQRGFFSAADRMYLLLEGAVVLSAGGKSLDTVHPGEIFGEMATITNSKRSATATPATWRTNAARSQQARRCELCGIDGTPSLARSR